MLTRDKLRVSFRAAGILPRRGAEQAEEDVKPLFVIPSR